MLFFHGYAGSTYLDKPDFFLFLSIIDECDQYFQVILLQQFGFFLVLFLGFFFFGLLSELKPL